MKPPLAFNIVKLDGYSCVLHQSRGRMLRVLDVEGSNLREVKDHTNNNNNRKNTVLSKCQALH